MNPDFNALRIIILIEVTIHFRTHSLVCPCTDTHPMLTAGGDGALVFVYLSEVFYLPVQLFTLAIDKRDFGSIRAS